MIVPLQHCKVNENENRKKHAYFMLSATLVPARAKHQARLNALPSAAESQQS